MNKVTLILFSLFLSACAQMGANKPVSDTADAHFKKPRSSADDMVLFGVQDEKMKAVALDDAVEDEGGEAICLPVNERLTLSGNDELIVRLGTRISEKWIKPANLKRQYLCSIHLGIEGSGCISDVKVSGCNDNKLLVRSIETAIFRAAPYPKIAEKQLIFQFVARP